MSLHAVEDAVQWSIECLHKSPRAADLDCRSLFKSLYDFQHEYDTGFTQFRVIGALISRRFTYVFKVDEHPDYDRVARHLETGEGFLKVPRDPAHSCDSKENPTAGYICDPVAEWGEAWVGENALPPVCMGRKLYCDAGSALWQRFVELGKLRGADAIAPRAIPVDEVAATVVREAALQGDREIVRVWFALLFWHIGNAPLEELRGNALVREVRSIAKRIDARAVPDFDYSVFRIPAEDDSYVPASAGWWFDPDIDT